MKLPFAVFTARAGYAWQSGLSAGLAKLDGFRRVIGKMPEADYGEPMTAGIATAGDEAIVWRFMREEKADNRGRDALYLALTFFPKTQAADIDVEALLAIPLFSATVRNPPDEVDYPGGPSRMAETIGRDGIFAPDGSLAAAGVAVSQVPAGTDLKIWREEPLDLNVPRGPARVRLTPASVGAGGKVSRAGWTMPVADTQTQPGPDGDAIQRPSRQILRFKTEQAAPPSRIPLLSLVMCLAILVGMGVSIGVFWLRTGKNATVNPGTEQTTTQEEAETPPVPAEKAQNVSAKDEEAAEQQEETVEFAKDPTELADEQATIDEKPSEVAESPQSQRETTPETSSPPQNGGTMQGSGTSALETPPDVKREDSPVEDMSAPEEHVPVPATEDDEAQRSVVSTEENQARQEKQTSVSPQEAKRRVERMRQKMGLARSEAEQRKTRAEENAQPFDSESWNRAEAFRRGGEGALETADEAKKRDKTAYVEACRKAFDSFREAESSYRKAATETPETNQP